MPKLSILHVSDLHKMEGTTYESLLQSLLTDRDSYVSAGVASPSYIVISGDLIQGGASDEEIQNQYAEVKQFLESLTNQFLEGDKSKVIMVPGNHDVSFPHSMRSMTKLAGDKNLEHFSLYMGGQSQIRWNWKDFSFYSISEQNQYNNRFELFKEFYKDFYTGIRSFPNDGDTASDFVSFSKDKVAFALFNSCCGLDHLYDTGNISPDALTALLPRLRSSYNEGYLNIAVWHHHYYGAPRESNYLDREVISMLTHGYIQVGLFGHQHISQVAEMFSSDMTIKESPENQRILLISSGTLFGGKKEIPDGYKRQYNIIQVETLNGSATIKINVREDGNRNVASKIPYWISKGNPIETNVNLRKLDEQTQFANLLRKTRRTSDYKAGYLELIQLPHEHEMYQTLRSEFIRNIKDNRFILDNIIPESPNDYILLMTCAIEEDDSEAKERLKNDKSLQGLLQDSILKEFYNQL